MLLFQFIHSSLNESRSITRDELKQDSLFLRMLRFELTGNSVRFRIEMVGMKTSLNMKN